jgi:sulfur-oxidizing protein SoxB
MVRTGGLRYTIAPHAAIGSRISDMRLNGKPIEADKTYKVAGWASVNAEAREAAGARPVWEVVEAWLRQQPRVTPRRPNTPTVLGVQGNPGLTAERP